jgi:hypothetical protein
MSVTDDAREFTAGLLPGDLLIFDSLGFESGLIQWADGAPANHAAMVIDETHLMEANRYHDDPDGPAVRRQPIAGHLGLDRVRTVTALRHIDVQARTKDAGAAVEAAKAMENTSTFAYLHLAVLGPKALRRTYGRDSTRDGLFGVALDLLLKVFEASMRRRAAKQPGRRGLSCSEFLYLCYLKGGLGVKIEEPMFRTVIPTWQSDAQREREAELWAQLGEPTTPPFDDLDAASVAPEKKITSERVTPADLLRSASLKPAAVLCKPIDSIVLNGLENSIGFNGLE